MSDPIQPTGDKTPEHLGTELLTTFKGKCWRCRLIIAREMILQVVTESNMELPTHAVGGMFVAAAATLTSAIASMDATLAMLAREQSTKEDANDDAGPVGKIDDPSTQH